MTPALIVASTFGWHSPRNPRASTKTWMRGFRRENDVCGGVTNEIRKCFAAMAFLSVNGEPRFVTRVESKGASPAAARLSPDGGAQFDPRSCA